MRPRAVEVCVTDVASAIAAYHGGADRVELCTDLGSGGVTPSAGMIARVVEDARLAVHVLVRPRPGGFVYSAAEVRVMAADVREAIRLGAAGVVVGALTRDGAIDRDVLLRLLEAAGDADVTFHRAIDLAIEPEAMVDALIGLGFARVLCSGQSGEGGDREARIGAVVARASGRLEVMVGGGVVEADLPGLLDRTGAVAVHVHSAVVGPAGPAGPFGVAPGVVEAERVRRVVDLVNGRIQ